MKDENKKNNTGNTSRNLWLAPWRYLSDSISKWSRIHLLENALRFLTLLPVILGFALLYENAELLLPRAYAAGSEQFSIDSATPVGYGNIGGTGTNVQYQAFTYKPQNTQFVCSVKAYIRKVGSPTDNLKMVLRNNQNNSLTSISEGSLLNTSAEISGSALSTTGDTLSEFTFPNCQALNPAVYYIFAIERTGTYGDTNKYSVGHTTGTPNSTIGRSVNYVPNTGSWVADTSTRIFRIFGFESLDIGGIDANISSSTNLGITSNLRSCSDASSTASLISEWACYAVQSFQWTIDYLFIPSASSTGISIFNNSLNSFENVFPFSLFFQSADVLYNSVATYETEDGSWTWTLPSSTAGTLSFNSSSLTSVIGTNTWATVREYIEYGTYILLLVGIIKLFV